MTKEDDAKNVRMSGMVVRDGILATNDGPHKGKTFSFDQDTASPYIPHGTGTEFDCREGSFIAENVELNEDARKREKAQRAKDIKEERKELFTVVLGIFSIIVLPIAVIALDWYTGNLTILRVIALAVVWVILVFGTLSQLSEEFGSFGGAIWTLTMFLIVYGGLSCSVFSPLFRAKEVAFVDGHPYIEWHVFRTPWSSVRWEPLYQEGLWGKSKDGVVMKLRFHEDVAIVDSSSRKILGNDFVRKMHNQQAAAWKTISPRHTLKQWQDSSPEGFERKILPELWKARSALPGVTIEITELTLATVVVLDE